MKTVYCTALGFTSPCSLFECQRVHRHGLSVPRLRLAMPAGSHLRIGDHSNVVRACPCSFSAVRGDHVYMSHSCIFESLHLFVCG